MYCSEKTLDRKERIQGKTVWEYFEEVIKMCFKIALHYEVNHVKKQEKQNTWKRQVKEKVKNIDPTKQYAMS